MQKKQILYIALGLFLMLFLLFGGKAAKAIIQPLIAPAPAERHSKAKARNITLQANDYVLFGSYQGEPILWQVLRIQEGKPLLWSSRILCFKAFDAAGEDAALHRGADFAAQGSNSWADSSLRQWLNCAEQEVPWSHCPPAAQNVLDGLNPYADEPGFLAGFTAQECSLLAERKGDLIFLLSQKEISGWVPAAKRAKRLTHTASVSDRSPYLNLPMSPEWYWTSTPANSTRTGVATVTTNGSFYKDPAYDGHTGVCPAALLKTQNVKACGNGTQGSPYQLEGAVR